MFRFLSQGVIEKHVSSNAPLRWVGTRHHPIPAVARNFVEQLLVGDPAVRLGGTETGGKDRFIHHAFMYIVVGLADESPARSYPSECLTVDAMQAESCVVSLFFLMTRVRVHTTAKIYHIFMYKHHTFLPYIYVQVP